MIPRDAFAYLLEALLEPHACVVLGSGASAPTFPLMGDIPALVASYALEVGSYPACTLASSPARNLIRPRSSTLSPLDRWKCQQVTESAAHLLLATVYSKACKCPPQYAVFRYFSHEMLAFSFNWDGLAERCMPQRVISPHGVVDPSLVSGDLTTLLEMAQLIETPNSDQFRSPGLVYPGEEAVLSRGYQRRFEIELRRRTKLIVIGFGFGLLAKHDTVWREMLETIVPEIGISTIFVDPNARELAESFKDRARYSGAVPVVANWHVLSQALHRLNTRRICIRSMIGDPRPLLYEYCQCGDTN